MRSLRTVLAAAMLSGAAFAAMVEMSPADLAAGSDLIVTGTVTGVASRWNSDQSAIYTDVTLSASIFEKGSADRVIVVRVPGGEVGDVGMAVEDYPVLQSGDNVRLHLTLGADGVFLLVGGMQGAGSTDAKPLAYYSYSGYHRDPASCNYYVNSGLPADWLAAIQAGDATWDAAGSAFRFGYLGTTTRTGPTYDGYNVVLRSNLGGGGILAQNTYWYNRTTKHVLENDIVFNTYYPWATSGGAGYYDVQNIGTHEMGHCLVLNDLYKAYQSEMTMYGYGATGETKKRILEFGDKDGIIRIYGAGMDQPGAKPSVD
jgi:hypothetical protein